MDVATIKEAVIVERAAINNLEKDIDADMEYWRTLRRFNREELSIISAKMKEIEERQDQQKWKA